MGTSIKASRDVGNLCNLFMIFSLFLSSLIPQHAIRQTDAPFLQPTYGGSKLVTKVTNVPEHGP